MVEQHPLSPFLPAGARLLMLGSFPPPLQRWSMHFFYPNFINDMWRIFGLVFFGDKLALVDESAKTFKLAEIKSMLTHKRIALYDTASAVVRLRGNASDEFLEISQPTDIAALISRLPECRAIAATGGKAAEEIARQLGASVPKTGESVETHVGSRKLLFYRMPSSSRAYPMRIERKAETYAAMMHDLGILP